jgi:hypothetical protein
MGLFVLNYFGELVHCADPAKITILAGVDHFSSLSSSETVFESSLCRLIFENSFFITPI